MTDETSILMERQPGRQNAFHVNRLELEKVFLPDQMLELHSVEGCLHVARKERRHDEWDRPIPPYDPCGPSDEFIDD
jgi:hypothetical protein